MEIDTGVGEGVYYRRRGEEHPRNTPMGAIGSSEFILVAIFFFLYGTPVIGVISALRFSNMVWQKAGFSVHARLLWIVLCLVLGPIGGIGYLLGIRPKLAAASRP